MIRWGSERTVLAFLSLPVVLHIIGAKLFFFLIAFPIGSQKLTSGSLKLYDKTRRLENVRIYHAKNVMHSR